jgi:hypothetical protein
VGGANYFQGDTGYRYGPAGTTAAQFSTNLAAGTYRVSVTWGASPVWTTNAVFTVLDGAGHVLATRSLNEQSSPNDFSAGGAGWEDVGTVTLSSAGSLVVKVTGGTSGQFLVADAARFESVAAAPPAGAPALAPSLTQETPAATQADPTATPTGTPAGQQVAEQQYTGAQKGATLTDLVISSGQSNDRGEDFGLWPGVSLD